MILKPPTNMPTSSQSVTGLNNVNQEKQLQEAKISVRTDALLMKKALVSYYELNLNKILFKLILPSPLSRTKATYWKA